jgi:hypothetical protein
MQKKVPKVENAPTPVTVEGQSHVIFIIDNSRSMKKYVKTSEGISIRRKKRRGE